MIKNSNITFKIIFLALFVFSTGVFVSSAQSDQNKFDNYGALIEEGPQNWQILQQDKGSADIALSGSWSLPDKLLAKSIVVLVCVVNENSGETVIPWMKCQKLADNRWQVIIRNVPAGGLYRIESCLKDTLTPYREVWDIRGDMIHHIGVGDLYVIAGQSNAAGVGRGPVYDPPEIGVHVLRNNGHWDLASHPLNDGTRTIHEETFENGNCKHTPYINFAKLLKRELGYPIGLLPVAKGGTWLSQWNPAMAGTYKRSDKTYESVPLYRNMLQIIKSQGGNIKGILWYQGENDAYRDSLAAAYLTNFGTFLTILRADLYNDSLPIITVQLNKCTYLPTEQISIQWGMVREAQRQAARKLKNVFIVPTIDLGMSDAIHNSSESNMIIGERLARAALAEIYHKPHSYKAPDLALAKKLDRSKVSLSFDNVTDWLNVRLVKPEDLQFTFIDETGKLEIKNYEMASPSVILISFKRPLNGKCLVRGCWEVAPTCLIPVDNGTMLPMLSFYGVEVK